MLCVYQTVISRKPCKNVHGGRVVEVLKENNLLDFIQQMAGGHVEKFPVEENLTNSAGMENFKARVNTLRKHHSNLSESTKKGKQG